MPIHVRCPNCENRLTAKDTLAGKHASCPVCKTTITVPTADSVPSPAPRPNVSPVKPATAATGSRASSPVRQFTALCSERAEDTAAPVLAEAAAPPQRTKKCRFCGEDIAVAATKCRYCGEWLQRVLDVPPPQIGIKVVPPASAVVFTIITLGIYQIFWLHRVFTELHARGSTETTPGKAVGFHFIPFFNLVWIFIVWKRLGDAIAREYVNARLPAPGTGVLWSRLPVSSDW